MNAQEIGKELQKFRGALTLRTPFLSSLLARCRIVADPKVKRVCVNANNEMRVNEKFLSGLNQQARIALFTEQALHIGLQHAQRMKGKDEELFNIAACCVVHSILDSHEFFANAEFPHDFSPVTPQMVSEMTKRPVEEIAKMSAEEIYHLLVQNKAKAKGCNRNDISSQGDGQKPQNGGQSQEDLDTPSGQDEENGQGEGNEEPQGSSGGGGKNKSDQDQKDNGKRQDSSSQSDGTTVIQEGDQKAYGGKVSKDDQKEYWGKALAQMLVRAKLAGKLPAGLEREIGSLLKPKVPWLSLVKKTIRDGLGRSFVSTWQRPSRRFDMLPGTKRLTNPKIWSLIDTSGSMGERELAQYLGEIAMLCRIADQAIVIPWDAKAYEPIVLKDPADVVKKLTQLKGGGGTMIQDALVRVEKLMKPGDIVVILTDGYIGDIAEPDVQDRLRSIRRRSICNVFVTTGATPPLPAGWRTIKIEI